MLLHGLGGNGPGNWSFIGPRLAGEGYCAFTITYGQASPLLPVGGTRPIAESAEQISQFIDQVRSTTGAEKVAVVGHSEGGFHSLYVPKVLDRSDAVGTVVALAPPTHGTTASGLTKLRDVLELEPTVSLALRLFGCQACPELLVGGSAVRTLTDGPIAVPGIDYTIVATRYDVAVTPTETSFVREPGVTNLYVQDVCPLDPVGHIGLAFDPTVVDLITNALDPTAARPVRCGFGPSF